MIEKPSRQASLEIHWNGSCRNLQIGTGNWMSTFVSNEVDDDVSSEIADQKDLKPAGQQPVHVAPELPAQHDRQIAGIKRTFKDVSDQLKQLEFRTEDGFLDLAAELDQLNEDLERSLKLRKRETELRKEESLLVNAKMGKMQTDLSQLQQQMVSLTKRCSDLERNNLKADKIIDEKVRRIEQLEVQIKSETISGKIVKLPKLAPCPVLVLVGHVTVRDIQLKTRHWLKIRYNWFIKWRDWIRVIVNWWGSRDHIPDTRDLLYQKIREWIEAIRNGVEMYIEYHGQLIRHYKFVKKLPRSTRKALKWNSLMELNVRICQVKLDIRVLEQGRDEELANLQSWLYNQTWGRIGVESTMRKYLVTAADGRVDWLKKMLNLDAAKNQLENILKYI